ncbi:MAG: autotransporter outer membrane beta-barrel domain-containing protein, partial [Peptostreptococcaceae bacterium]
SESNGAKGIYASGKSEYDSSTGTSIYVKANVENSGSIKVDGNYAKGIELNNADLINKGHISVSGENALGIVSIVEGYSSEIPEITNDGLIIVNGNSGYDLETSEIVTGIRGFNYGYNKGIITNNGKIEVESSNDDARGIDSYGNDVINNGIISVKGNGVVGGFDTNGIRVQGQYGTVTATNNGIINVDGKGAWGMYAGMGGVAINSETGTINVSATAEGAMIASGGTAINHGTINIEAGNLNTDIKFTDEFGNEIVKSAMFATNGGTIENYGTINTDGNLTLGSSTGGNYVIGTSEDGSYGKISAKNVDINGEVTVSANITKNGFKDEYTMQNVVDAEDITLGDEFKLVSNSLLYDAEGVIDRWGNLDATLSRNDKVLSDFTTGYINDSAEIFGKYQNEESFKTLSSEAKEVIKAIDTSSLESIEKSLNSLTPTIYSNLGRQMLETTETFKAQDLVSINSLGENSYNFTFIGEYRDVDSRKGIEGYESKLTGFVGAMNFGDGTFGTIGYGHNKLDYTGNGDGKIETIHLGLNRFMSYSGLDLRVGLGGEYNFHENKRDVEILSRKAESDFDSYGVNASVEISKKLGEKTYLKPFLGLDLSHMKYDSFSEKGAKSANVKVESESYTSVTPKAGAIVGGA